MSAPPGPGDPAALERFRGRPVLVIGDAILDFETSVVTEADKRPLDEKGNPYTYRWPGARNIGE